jgi:hypothetical protein
MPWWNNLANDSNWNTMKAAAAALPFVPIIDWDSVTKQVGDGATSAEWETQFLTMEIQEETTSARQGSITPETTPTRESKEAGGDDAMDGNKDDSYTADPAAGIDWLNLYDANVAHATTEAALLNTTSLNQAPKAALAGLAMHQDVQDAVTQEGAVARLF